MALEFRRNEVVLSQSCGAEEALELVDWLSRHKRPKVHLGACEHLHAALLQTLLAHKPAVSVGPTDPFLRSWVLPLLVGTSELA
jgi:hypothetical protein